MIKVNTKQLIANSLNNLLKTQSFSSITVMDIVKSCDISRTTFYKYFKDKYELSSWMYIQDIDDYLSQFDNLYAFQDQMLHCFEYLRKKESYLNKILKYDGQNSLSDFIYRYVYDVTYKRMCSTLNVKVLDEDRDTLLKIYLWGALRYFYEWIGGGMRKSPQEMAGIMIDAIPVKLQKDISDF